MSIRTTINSYMFNYEVIYFYIKSLKFEDRPDYDSITTILSDCLKELGEKNFQWDWILQMKDPELFYDRKERNFIKMSELAVRSKNKD